MFAEEIVKNNSRYVVFILNVLFVYSRQNSLGLFHSEFDFSTFRWRENCQVSDLCDARSALHMLHRGRFQFLN